MASVTGPVYKLAVAGQGAFWFGLAAYLILLPILIYRAVNVREMEKRTLPTPAIFSAPAGLFLAGYMNSFMIVKFQELSGALITLYVLIRYIGFLWPRNRMEKGRLTIENGQ